MAYLTPYVGAGDQEAFEDVAGVILTTTIATATTCSP